MLNFFRTLKQLTSQGGIEGFVAIKYAEIAKNSPLMRDSYKNLATEAASEIQKGKILEVGPGPGFLAIEVALLSPELQVTGLDISETMIEIAVNNAKEHDVSERIEFRKGDASEMPFKNSVFDFVISSGSLHHWKEPIKVFNEIYRVLKEGKKALISDLRKDAPKEQIETLAKNLDSKLMRWGLRKSFREAYTTQEIEDLINDTKFTNFRIEMEGISHGVWLTK